MTGRDEALRRVSSYLFLIALLLAAGLAVLATAQTTPLRVGDTLPQISGQTLSGKQLTLAADAAGKPAVVAFSFSRAGGKDSSLWSDHIEKDFPAVGHPYTLMMIEAAPEFVRGMIISGSKKGMPPAAQDRCIAMEKDEESGNSGSVSQKMTGPMCLCWGRTGGFAGGARGRFRIRNTQS